MLLSSLDSIVVIAYFIALSCIGIYFSPKQTTRQEYYLGGHRVHWLLAGGSIFATLISTLTFLSAPGELIRYGVGYFTGILSLPLVVPAINRILMPVFRSRSITSLYEYLEYRFCLRMRILASASFVLRTLIWMGLITYSCSYALAPLFGISIYSIIVFTGIVTTFYSSIGGFRTVIWTDNLQALILLIGAFAIPVYVAFKMGIGPSEWWGLFAQTGHGQVPIASFDPSVRITILGMSLHLFFWTLCTNASDQVTVQRYLSTPSLSAARCAAWVFTVLKVVLLLVLMFGGLAMFAWYHEYSNQTLKTFYEQFMPRADQALPRFIAQQMPPGLSGLILAALLAAAMSSLSSCINSISSVVVTDFMERFASPTKPAQSLKLDKIIGAAAGVWGIIIATGLAYTAQYTRWNLYELTSRFNNIFLGPVAVLFFAGILFPKAQTAAAVTGFSVSLAVSIFISFSRELLLTDSSISFTWIVPVSSLSGVAGVWLAKCFELRHS